MEHILAMTRSDYNKIYENAISMIDSANRIAEIGNFGTAISLLILGLEELIKYQVVLNNSSSEKLFSESEFNETFKFHKKKHKLIEEYIESLSKNFSHKFLNYVLKVSSNQTLSDQDENIKKNRFKEIGNFLNNSYSEITLPETERKEFINWLKDANNLKNNGFYVNLNNNQLESPSKFDISDYERALKFVTVIQKQTEIIKSLDISEEEFINLMNSEI